MPHLGSFYNMLTISALSYRHDFHSSFSFFRPLLVKQGHYQQYHQQGVHHHAVDGGQQWRRNLGCALPMQLCPQIKGKDHHYLQQKQVKSQPKVVFIGEQAMDQRHAEQVVHHQAGGPVHDKHPRPGARQGTPQNGVEPLKIVEVLKYINEGEEHQGHAHQSYPERINAVALFHPLVCFPILSKPTIARTPRHKWRP